eukprot:1158220-Pelagomonas_calceolata.AAC.3
MQPLLAVRAFSTARMDMHLFLMHAVFLAGVGELSEPVKTEDCLWNFEGGVVDITLQKQDGMHWWSSVIKVGGGQVMGTHGLALKPSAHAWVAYKEWCFEEAIEFQ